MLRHTISIISAITLVTAAIAADTALATPEAPVSMATLLHDYDYLRGEIEGLQTRIDRIDADIDTTGTDLRVYDKRMGELSDSMIQLRGVCGEYLVTARKVRRTSPVLSFFTSRKSVYSSIRRNGYIKVDIAKAHRELRDLNDKYFSVFNEKERLRYLIDHESDLYAMRDNIMERIDNLEEKAADVMTLIDPRRDEAEALLETRNANAAALDNELASAYIVRIKRDRPAAAPETAPESKDDTATASDFESGMGALLFPVSGKYNIVGRFGRYVHPEYENITVYNPGIDIETRDGAKARAVFSGTVEAIYDITGFNKVVVVSHGNGYHTVYGNLADVRVKVDSEVSDGEILGVVASDNNHTVLHFEVRRGADPLDPTLWVKL